MSEINDGSSIPLISSPLMSMCEANQGESSSLLPVRILHCALGPPRRIGNAERLLGAPVRIKVRLGAGDEPRVQIGRAHV